jgi:signal transduction histidine kinase
VERHVDVRISDRGSGIAPEHFGLIFESFAQVDEGLKKQHGGMGLGLAISREFALGMGGDLFVESVLGEGSTFTLTLTLPGGSDDPPPHAQRTNARAHD